MSVDHPTEFWRPITIEGFPGYRVSSLGRVQSCWKCVGLGHGRGARWVTSDRWRDLKPQPHRDGYLRVVLCGLAGRKYLAVHQLVAAAFVGPCPAGLECCHNDGDPTNNRLGNLRYDTHAGNIADRKKHGTDNAGSRHPRAKLTEADIPAILELRSQGWTQQAVADRFGVSRRRIRGIEHGESWTHVTGRRAS